MSFLAPERLWLLVGVAALAAGYVVLQLRRRHVYTVRFTHLELLDVVAPRRPGWRRHLTAALVVAGLGALVVAFAEPTREVRVPRERATVVLAVDVSLSMDASDVLPSRLDAAKAAAVEFVDGVPPSINVGLVAFAGRANVLVPPTTDHDDVVRALHRLELAEGTAVGEAIHASLDALATLPEPADGAEPVPATVIVLSDGTTTVGRPDDEAAAAAAEAGVPVSTIAFGTEAGVIFVGGEAIPVPPDLAAMEAIAETTGGVFFEAESSGQLEAAYADLGTSIGYDTERRPVSEWFVGSALGALAVAAAFSLAWSSRLP